MYDNERIVKHEEKKAIDVDFVSTASPDVFCSLCGIVILSFVSVLKDCTKNNKKKFGCDE
jgi:hypothetical protein